MREVAPGRLGPRLLGLGAMFVLAAPAARADEPQPAPRARPEVAITGHLKTFSIAVFPYAHPLLPDAPTGQTLLDGRLNLRARLGPRVELLVAHAVTPTLGGGAGLVVANTGVAPIAPELVGLGWRAGGGGALSAVGRTDRLRVKVAGDGFDLTVGRQPVSFGSGAFFTPLDLVNPFTPATIDTEYKPGVDAVRLDLYRGVGAQLTAVASWAGPPVGDREPASIRDLAGAVAGTASIGGTDATALVGLIRGDLVVGGGFEGAIGPVRVYGDAALTLPEPEGEDPFVRAVVGANHQVTDRLMVAGELYVQTLGTSDPAALLSALQGPRYARGELWLAGVAYGGLAASFEITPLVRGSLGGFVNLTDPSLLVAPSLAWSVADDAEVIAGAFAGIGQRPSTPALPPGFGIRSEFGLYPAVAFVSMRAWF
jgi:hypothetical protein